MFLANVAQTSKMSMMLEIEKAEGVFIYDTNGKRYFDLNSGICVSSLGHRHPKVIEAVTNQLSKHLHTMVYGEHIQQSQVAFAELLCSQIPENLDSIYYLLSGSEAVELAMKLAKRYTGRYEIIACKNAYHGSTQGAESLRSDHEYSRAFMPLLPGIKHIDYNDKSQLNQITKDTAAIILEPVAAESGIRPPKDNYLKAVRERCNQTGTLMILDEIQTGFGRTGHLFAFQKYGITPDAFCVGKAMGAGMPLSGVVSSKEILNSLCDNPALGHITTFGGHPVSCAAALAGLQTLIEDDITASIAEKELFIQRKLKHEIVKEVRSSGLMMAVELTKRKYLKHVVSHAFEEGALIDYFLFDNKSFRLAPPLVYTMDQFEEAMSILLKALDFAKAQYS